MVYQNPVYTIATTSVVLPSVIQGQENGKVSSTLLRGVGDGRGAMIKLVSYGMQALHIAAAAGGFVIATTGRGRSYDRQVAMFLERYTRDYLPDRPYKTWNGVRWYQKPGTAMAATPGTSNHGWWSADDVAEVRNGQVVGIGDAALIWMRDNAPSFGFGLETTKERWHWHWIAGNSLPQRAVDVLRYCGIPIDLPGYEQAPAPEPTPVPEPQPAPTPAPSPDVNFEAGVYGLWPLNKSKEVLKIGSKGDAVCYAQSVLKLHVARFATWFQATGQADSAARNLYLIAAARDCTALAIDGDYGNQTAQAVGFVQEAFRNTNYDGRWVGEMVADKEVGNAQTWPFLDSLADGSWK